MKRFKFYAVIFALITFVACSDDDFESILTTDLETETLVFSAEGGEQSFLLESNDKWFIGELPNWLSVKVTDIEEVPTRASITAGKKQVTVVAKANTENEARTSDLILSTLNGKMVKLKVTQEQKIAPEKEPVLAGYWILSEGYLGSADSELAWYDIAKDEVAIKQFKEINDKPLGDTGNALELYGSKMYVLITGAGYGTETTEENSYIEVVNPIDGKSIKRIPFKDAEGIPAKPRSIIFEGGHAYISSYSSEVVRLDTATLTLDKHAVLSGTLPEGLTYSNGNIYVCNGGQGTGNTISVVDIKEMKETKAIETVNNPNHIVTAGNGGLYFNTDWPEYKLYNLKTTDNTITEVSGLSVADFTYANNNLYTSFFDWDTYSGEVNQFDITTTTATEFNIEIGSAEYHIGTINGSNLLYLTGMDEEVVIFDPATKEIKHAFKTGTPGGNGVVAIYK